MRDPNQPPWIMSPQARRRLQHILTPIELNDLTEEIVREIMRDGESDDRSDLFVVVNRVLYREY